MTEDVCKIVSKEESVKVPIICSLINEDITSELNNMQHQIVSLSLKYEQANEKFKSFKTNKKNNNNNKLFTFKRQGQLQTPGKGSPKQRKIEKQEQEQGPKRSMPTPSKRLKKKECTNEPVLRLSIYPSVNSTS